MFFKTTREICINIPIHKLASPDLDSYILQNVTNSIVGVHDSNGIIVPGSVSIISRSPFLMDNLQFGDVYKIYVRYLALCIDAPKGTTYKAEVQNVLPNGVLATTHHKKLKKTVFRTFIPYSINDEYRQEAMRGLIKGDIIEVTSIGRRGGLGDETIVVLSKFNHKIDKTNGEIMSIPISQPVEVDIQSRPLTEDDFIPEPVKDTDEHIDEEIKPIITLQEEVEVTDETETATSTEKDETNKQEDTEIDYEEL